MSATTISPMKNATVNGAQGDRSRFLSNVLLENAIFSALSGTAFIFFSQPIANFVGAIPAWVILIMGLGLLGFAAIVYRTARTQPLKRSEAVTILVMDILWVAASAAILLTGWLPFTTGGKWFVAILADIVGLFAILEYIGLRRMRSDSA